MNHSQPKDADRRRRAAELGARANLLSLRAVEVTTPVYWPDDRRHPEVIGSAVLVALGEGRFLVTAAHVLDFRHKRPLAATAAGKLIPIEGEVGWVYSIAAKSSQDDPIDIGVVRLTGDRWVQAPGAAFADWSELDHADSVVARNSFGLVGYPCTKQKNTVRADHLGAYAYRVIGLEAPEATYRAESVDPQESLMVGFNKKLTWGPEGRVTAPDLQGVSGGGLWRFGRHLHFATEPARLAGVVIEWHRGRHKYVLATRIWPILAALASGYPDVKEFVRRQMETATSA